MTFKIFTEGRIAYPKFLSNFLNADIFLQSVTYQPASLTYNINAIVLILKQLVLGTLLRIIKLRAKHLSNSTKHLLMATLLCKSNIQSVLKESIYLILVSYMCHWIVARKKVISNPMIYNVTFKSDPVTLPSSVFNRPIGVPLTRHNEKQVSSPKFDFRMGSRL